MKYSVVLSLAAVSSAFVVPSEQVLADLAPPRNQHHDSWYDEAVDVKDSIYSSVKKNFAKVSDVSKHAWEEISEKSTDAWEEISEQSTNAWDDIFDKSTDAWDDFTEKSSVVWDDVSEKGTHAWEDISEKSTNAFDDAMTSFTDASDSFASAFRDTASDVESWFDAESAHFEKEVKDRSHQVDKKVSSWWSRYNDQSDEHDDHPPHGPPPHHPPPHRRPPHHRRPHHPPHHHKPNETVYQLIANSKYTTKLAFFINQYPDLVKSLNSTKANFTIFAPTDRAFAKIPEHAPKPSKEELLSILSYHVVPGLYPAGRVLGTHTVATLLQSDHLGAKPLPQRLSFHLSLRGLTVNFYSRIVAVNIIGTNGIIHGVDSVIAPPPRVVKIIQLLPSEFSTLELGLAKTGLLEKLNTTKHAGGTFFAPSNHAFAKLGPRINAFLFSEHGEKYLKALLEYHVVPKNTLYSDAYYTADNGDEDLPRGRFHVELPTLLKDRTLGVDIARWGGWITIKVNAFTSVAVQDGVAADGVIQALGSVLIPPKRLGGDENVDVEDMDVEEFKSHFDGLVGKTDL